MKRRMQTAMTFLEKVHLLDERVRALEERLGKFEQKVNIGKYVITFCCNNCKDKAIWDHFGNPLGLRMSKCCGKEVEVTGGTTKYYTCVGCGKACDLRVRRKK